MEVVGHRLKVWCGYCKAYVYRATLAAHLKRHAERLERSAGPETDELEGEA